MAHTLAFSAIASMDINTVAVPCLAGKCFCKSMASDLLMTWIDLLHSIVCGGGGEGDMKRK
jgi:hypothetical protein